MNAIYFSACPFVSCHNSRAHNNIHTCQVSRERADWTLTLLIHNHSFRSAGNLSVTGVEGPFERDME